MWKGDLACFNSWCLDRRGNWITLKMKKFIKPKSRERVRSLTQTPSRSESSEGFLNVPHADSQDSSSVGSGSNSLEDSLSQRTSSEYIAPVNHFYTSWPVSQLGEHTRDLAYHNKLRAVLLFLSWWWWWMVSSFTSDTFSCSFWLSVCEGKRGQKSNGQWTLCLCSVFRFIKRCSTWTSLSQAPFNNLQTPASVCSSVLHYMLVLYYEADALLVFWRGAFFLLLLAVWWQLSKSFRSWGTDPRRKTERRPSTAAQCVRHASCDVLCLTFSHKTILSCMSRKLISRISVVSYNW